MSKHTEGPWMVTNGVDIWPDDGDTRGTRHIAHCGAPDDPDDVLTFRERQQNARLIAAAPELLDALVRLLRANEADYEHLPDMDVRTAFETNSMAIKQARAAIAKAKGEQ